MADMTHLLKIIIEVTDRAAAPLKNVEKSLNNLDRSFGWFNKKMLGLGLGMTFFMWGINMQLHRMLRSMFNIFEQAEGKIGALNQQFNIVRVNLAAISIAFFDAFAQSGLFDIVLSFVQNAADWFLNLSDAGRTAFVETTLKIVGTILAIQFLGQLLLAINTIMAQNPWVKMAEIAILSIIAIVLAYKKFKSIYLDENSKIENTNKIFWANFELESTHSLGNVIENILALGSTILRFLGLDSGQLSSALSTLRTSMATTQQRIVDINSSMISPSAQILKKGGYIDGRYIGAGGIGNYPTTNPNFVPNQGNQAGSMDELYNLLARQQEMDKTQKVEIVNTDILFKSYNNSTSG